MLRLGTENPQGHRPDAAIAATKSVKFLSAAFIMRSFFDVARVLGHASRYAIFAALGEQGSTASQLSRQLGLSVSVVSTHLATLRKAKLVEAFRHGRRHVHRWRRGERLALVVHRVPPRDEPPTPTGS